MTAENIAMILGGILGSGTLAALITWAAGRRKNEVDTTGSMWEIWQKMDEHSKKMLSEMEQKLKQLESQQKHASGTIAGLREDVSRYKECARVKYNYISDLKDYFCRVKDITDEKGVEIPPLPKMPPRIKNPEL